VELLVSVDVFKRKGFRLLLSNYDAWYFDCGYGAWVGPGQNANNWCSPYNGWQTVYNNDPKKIVQDFGLSWNASQVGPLNPSDCESSSRSV